MTVAACVLRSRPTEEKMMTVVKNQFYPDSSISIALITDVEDAGKLREGVMTGQFEAALLNSAMVLDEFQLVTAANQAIHCQRMNKMVTKTVHSEILYRLSPSKNISESFKKFGVGDKDRSVCLVIVNDNNNSVLNLILDLSKGKLTSLEKLSETADMEKIKKIYKLSDGELSSCSALDAIVSRIASKDVLTV